jgi:L-alanine-DL-glutamate epimerase-like enolase superfamily enzyme
VQGQGKWCKGKVSGARAPGAPPAGGKPDWRDDARRVRAVRSQLGDDVTLMCDANQRWDLATASRIMPVLEEAQLDWVEEPLHADDLDSHQRLQRSTRLPLDARRVHRAQRHPRNRRHQD